MQPHSKCGHKNFLVNALKFREPQSMPNTMHPKSVNSLLSGNLYSRNMLVLCFAFLAINVAMYLLAVPGGALKFGADSGDYYVPAQALYEHGKLSLSSHPDTLKNYRTPGYQMLLAAAMWLTNGSPISLIIGLQAAMLLLTGLATKSITEHWLPGYGDAALGLIIFNPNALISSQLIQTDTSMSFLFVMAIWSIDRYIKTENLWTSVTCGLFLSLSCLVRPTPQYFIAILPIAFPLGMVLSNNSHRWRRHIAAGILATIMACIAILPWMHHMASQGEGYTISSARIKFVFIMDNVLILEQLRSGSSQIKVGEILRQREAAYMKSNWNVWKNLSKVDRYKRLTTLHLKSFTEYPMSILAKAAIIGTGNMFVGGNAASYHRLLDLEHRTAADIAARETSSNYFLAFIKSLAYSSPVAVVISMVAIGFAAIMRILGTIGLVAIIARRHWALLLIIAAVVSYFALIHVFNSSARYRMPIDPLLLILALFGFDTLRTKFLGSSK